MALVMEIRVLEGEEDQFTIPRDIEGRITITVSPDDAGGHWVIVSDESEDD